MFAPCLLGYRRPDKMAAPDMCRHRPTLVQRGISEQSSGLLIRGFGVQVPGGAPVLTWPYTDLGCPEVARFWAMFAPRLLVSLDLVDRAAPAASRAPGQAAPVAVLAAGFWLERPLPMALHSVMSTG